MLTEEQHMSRVLIFAIVVGLGLEVLAAPPVPRTAPQLTLRDTAGNPLSLGSYAGKVLLVQFLYTTCPHCQAASRSFNALQHELGSRGLQVVGVAFNEEAENNNAAAVKAY